MSTNKWIGTGRLTKDPELKFTQGKGTAVVSFDLAVNDGFGQDKKVYYIPVVVWGKSAENVANFTHKGSLVAVTGKLTTRSYTAKDGSKRYVTEVVADMMNGIEFLDGKNGSSSNNQGGYQQGTIPGDYFGNGDMTPIDDGEDMPF